MPLKFKADEPCAVSEPTVALSTPDASELVIDAKTGRVRQAGATQAEGPWVVQFRLDCERDLYTFTKGVLKRELLSPRLHGWFCRSLQTKPRRKLRLMPRGHLKSSVVSEALPIHMHIQPDPSDGTNAYWLGVPGSEMNIILCGEKKSLMASHLRWVATQWETNDLLRALWPHRCWQNPRRDSKKWNEEEIIIPRVRDYADPSLRVIGVDGAITGAHGRVLIKDDLISIEAANSAIVMQRAIDWHISSRALLAPFEDIGLEFIIGTRWATHDLYSYITANDTSVDCRTRSILESDAPIWPEQITLAHIDDLKKEYGVLFWLLYMNSTANPELSDFDVGALREYCIEGDEIVFDEDERDVALRERANPPPPAEDHLRGTVLNTAMKDALFADGQGRSMRFRAR